MKKIMLLVVFSLFVMSNSVMADTESFGPDEWTQYRMNSENNPVFNGEISDEIKEVIKTGNEIRSTPVVVGDNVYIGNHKSGGIYSYNIKTKKFNWKAEAPNWIHSEIIYANNQLFVGYGNRFFQEDGTRGTEESGVLSLDPESGEILWDFKTKGEVMPTPAFYEDTLYITTGDKHLYAVDPVKGEEKWRLELGHTISMSSPNIKDGILYVGGGNPRPYTFFAVDLNKREILWETSYEDVYLGMDDVPPAIYKNQYVITTGLEETDDPSKPNHMIYAMDLKTGEVKWKDSFGTGKNVENNKSGAPVVYGDQVFVGSPITKTFYSYDAKTGKQLWNYPSNVNKAPPVADNDIVYFTDTKGYVYAFDTETGDLLGKKELGGKLAPSGPVLMSGHLIVGSQDTNVYILPIKEILNVKDSNLQGAKVSKSGFSYVWPALALLVVVLGILILIRIRNMKRNAQ
ncbi:PQQ-binding-like beta-propeller repeat protein [Mesobacillus sp.]|uniref:outer membrane protein assembly factor BamB family protein n=1 Tax=Mesobacillus sp. TaxID=2675271 RepID=UPI0039EE9AA8